MSPLGSGPPWKELIRSAFVEFPCVGAAPPVDGLSALLDRVVEWNQRADLTAARTREELVDLYVADAACLASTVDPSARERWIDVGSGAGAPAVPLALLRPNIELELIEPRSKRVAFLRTLVGVLGVTNVVVTRARSDEIDDGRASVAMSRATLPPEQWLAEGARLAERSVWVLLARERAPNVAGWQSARDLTYRWPLTNVQRRAIEYVRAC